MATIIEETIIEAPAAFVWGALRDIRAVHTRIAPGFVTDTKMESDDVRVVTFANGATAREPIISVDDARMRVAWSAESAIATHYNASAQVFEDGPARCRFVWTADMLPHEAARTIGPMIRAGTAATKAHMEAAVKPDAA